MNAQFFFANFSLFRGAKIYKLTNKYCNAPAGDAHGHGRLARGDDDSDPRVSAAAHGAATGVHHEADQEPAMVTSVISSPCSDSYRRLQCLKQCLLLENKRRKLVDR